MKDKRTIDIVMTSRNRLGYLKQSVQRIRDCTRYPYALHVIDDQSDPDSGIIEWLLDKWRVGWFSSLTLRHERAGIHANKNASMWLALSELFVITADDLLCPDLDPCWLERGVEIMSVHPEVGECDLNHPGAYRIVVQRHEDVTYCRAVGGTFGFVRRSITYRGWHHPHYRGNYGGTDDVMRSDAIREMGMQVAFFNDLYTYHLGEWSAQSEGPYGGPCIEPIDWRTLEPPKEWRQ